MGMIVQIILFIFVCNNNNWISLQTDKWLLLV